MNNLKNTNTLTINSTNIKKTYLEINGTYNSVNAKLFYKINNDNLIKLNTFTRIDNNHELVTSFTLKINKQINNISFFIKNKTEKQCELLFDQFAKLNNIKSSYFIYSDQVVFHNTNTVFFKKKNKMFLREIKYLYDILLDKQIKVFGMRIIYWITKPFFNKKIWLICDKFDKADDNAEHFFKYANNDGSKNIKYYYCISKKSNDINKLKKIGNVVYFRTLKYFLLYLNADNIISSQIGPFIRNSFGKKEKYFTGLEKSNFIFLQHGIIKEDLSNWLNKFNKNIAMFVTSTTKEYNSIIETENYHYDESVIKLTGLPRFDDLVNSKEKIENKIIFMPTWREKYANPIDHKTETRPYYDKFTSTEYFIFFNKLINDKILIDVLKEYNYKAVFCLHPCHSIQFNDFKSNNYCKVIKDIDYQYEFKSAKMMVTDFSSVTFDFAYLNKPIIYAQFDIKNMTEGHTYIPGSTKYYSYEKDGFGPLLFNYESTLDEIIKYIKNDCKIEKKYIERINKIYKYHDCNNCKRVYNEIINLKEEI